MSGNVQVARRQITVVAGQDAALLAIPAGDSRAVLPLLVGNRPAAPFAGGQPPRSLPLLAEKHPLVYTPYAPSLRWPGRRLDLHCRNF